MSVKEKITRTIGRSVLKAKKNSPHIFFAIGLAGIVGSTVLACKSTLKLEENLDKIKEDFDEVKQVNTLSEISKKDKGENADKVNYYKDMGYVYIKSTGKLCKLYGPSIVVGGLSIAALTGSHVQLTRRNSALTFTLTALTKAFDEYRTRVKKEVGENRELEIYRGIQDKKFENNGNNELVIMEDTSPISPYARFFDEFSTEWKKDPELNKIFLTCQQNYMNHLLRARGHVFLNEVYDCLGLERSQAGAVVGWVVNGNGDGYIDFGMYYPRGHDFINNLERNVLLDFNVDGVIFNKI